MTVCGDEVSVAVSIGLLDIADSCTDSGLLWTELVLPEWEYRYAYAPPSQWIPGNVLMSAVPESSAITMRVLARGTTVADLEAQKELLRAALSVYPNTFTALADFGTGPVSVGGPWSIMPTIPQWGSIAPLSMGLLAAEASFSIPVNPAGA